MKQVNKNILTQIQEQNINSSIELYKELGALFFYKAHCISKEVYNLEELEILKDVDKSINYLLNLREDIDK